MNFRSTFLSMVLTAVLILSTGCASPERVMKDTVETGVRSAMGVPSGPGKTGEQSESPREDSSSRTRQTTETTPSRGTTSTPTPGSAGWSQYMVTHARLAFTHTFAPGGIWLSQKHYRPGEWTRYEFRGLEGNDVVTVERALLKIRDDGKEWWRVEWSAQNDRWIYEGLIDPDSQELLRLKAKGPRGEANEVPVQKGTRVFQSTQKLTEESIQGAIVGTESISIDGQTYSTQHVRYGAAMTAGALEWWVNEDVPGGLVKYQIRDNNDRVIWTSELTGHGSGATPKLGMY